MDLGCFFTELSQLDKSGIDYSGRMLVSDRAHLVTKLHKLADQQAEAKKGSGKIGTTGKGIGPSYATKMLRIGIRVGDLIDWDRFVEKYNTFIDRASDFFGITEYDRETEIEEFKAHRAVLIDNNMIINATSYLSKAIGENKRIMAEGANALMLDIDHGTYPFVTSSNPSIGSICTGLGVPPQVIET